jgi:hypothetical protein|tara:strand:- start:176 stop:919 length:744 start_codon:yes stop_codon:yes gene_type:complete
MKELTPEQIQENWKKLIQIVKDTFEEGSERREKLLNMYHYFEERMCLAPASGKEHFHNAHAGGYVEHILHIVKFSKQIADLWEQNGATINFTDEELIFAALHHDLGKVGDLAEDYYVPQDNDWWIKNRGEYYKHNGKLHYMTVTDRAVFLLQHFGIKMSEQEYLGLRLTDGMYEDANKNYYVSYQPERQLKTNIAYVLHQADLMSSVIEYDMWKRGDYDVKVEPVKQKEKSEKSKRSHELFKELFDE